VDGMVVNTNLAIK